MRIPAGMRGRAQQHGRFGVASVGVPFPFFCCGEWRIANSEERRGPTRRGRQQRTTKTGFLSPFAIRTRPLRGPPTVAFQQKLAPREWQRASSSSTAIAGEVAVRSTEVGATMVQNNNGDSVRRKGMPPPRLHVIAKAISLRGSPAPSPSVPRGGASLEWNQQTHIPSEFHCKRAAEPANFA